MRHQLSNGYFLIFQCTRIVIACCVLHNIRKDTGQRDMEVEGRIEDDEDNEEVPHEADGRDGEHTMLICIFNKC